MWSHTPYGVVSWVILAYDEVPLRVENAVLLELNVLLVELEILGLKLFAVDGFINFKAFFLRLTDWLRIWPFEIFSSN